MIKTISEEDRNPIYSLPVEERMKIVNENLKKLHEMMPDISFFDIGDYDDLWITPPPCRCGCDCHYANITVSNNGNQYCTLDGYETEQIKRCNAYTSE